MALVDNAWYVDFGNGSSTGYYGVSVWSNHTAVAGEIIRQATTPGVGGERCFICTTAGATGAVEPTWTITRGALNTSSSAVYQEATGVAAINGDATNTPTWSTVTNNSATAITLGQVIKRNNGASYWICTVAGTSGSSEPVWANNTAGTTQADSGVTWTGLGVVGNFTGWQAPHARLANAYAATWGQAANSFFLATEHAETQSTTITLTSPGGATTPCLVYSVTKTTVPPVGANVSTGATVTTTGSTSITFAGTNTTGNAIYSNIAFSAATGAGGGSVSWGSGTNSFGYYQRFNSCTFTNASTNAGVTFSLSNGTNAYGKLDFYSCTFVFSATGQSFTGSASGTVRFIGCTIGATGSVPTTLFTNTPAQLLLQAVDLTNFGTGKTLISGSGGGGTLGLTSNFIDCKLGASVTKCNGITGSPNMRASFIRTDSAATSYIQENYTFYGSQVVETTIVRTGGASDGTTPISWKIVTNASGAFYTPFECIPITIWNSFISATHTVTVFGIWGGGGVPNNDQIWVDVEYLGTASFPLGVVATATKANGLASGVALSSDGSTWGGSTTPFKITLNITPTLIGYLNIYVKAATASTTFYIDPAVGYV